MANVVSCEMQIFLAYTFMLLKSDNPKQEQYSIDCKCGKKTILTLNSTCVNERNYINKE